jgi:signal transduction histidine kinase
VKDISLSEKLILYFMLLGFGAIIIVSTFSFYSTRDALLDRTFDQLTSLRIAKKNQVETFFSDRNRDVLLLARSEETRKMAGLLAIKDHDDKNKPNSTSDRIKGSRLSFFEKYRPLKEYFSSMMIISGNGRTYCMSFGNEGLDPKGICEHLSSGELSGFLAKLITVPGKVVLSDEILVRHSGEPSLFIGTLIRDQGEKSDEICGRLILEIPVDKINSIMLNNDPKSGLGTSGETYLVGKDYRMRSESRFQEHSVLRTIVNTGASKKALSGSDGTIITRDYRKIPVLSAFSGITVSGLDWVILAEMDLEEAMIPIYHMRNTIIALGTILALIFFVFVFIFSRKLTKPIIQLKDAAKKIGEGNYETVLPVTSNDEIGSLTQSFNIMTEQIKEKTDELRYERLGRLRSVIDAEETERQRLSREIHDGIGQSLIALKLRMEGLLYCDEKDLKDNINILKDQFDGTVDEIRRISNNLMPSVLEAFGITIALRNLSEETEEHSGIRVHFQCTGDLEMLSTRVKTYIFRIAQEALNNVIKHSGASLVELKLSRKEDFVIFTVKDDGKGFNVDRSPQDKGNGLHNMRERVALMTGSIDIRSVIHNGTTITIKIPVY